MLTQKKPHEDTLKVAIYKLGRELSPETEPTRTLVTGVWPPELRENKNPARGVLLWLPELTNTERQLEKYHIKSNKNINPFKSNNLTSVDVNL